MVAFAGSDRGIVGSVISTTDENGATVRAILPQMQVVGATGGVTPDATVTDPAFQRTVGTPSIATSQATTSISPANAVLLVAARAGRHAVTLSNITGAQPVFIVSAANATGATTGFFLAGTVGATVTIQTAAALYGTSPTAGQVVGVIEAF